MGIQGLKKYILNNDHIRRKVSLQEFVNDSLDLSHGAPQLLCDFIGTLEWLLSDVDSCLVKRGKLSPFSLLCGGDLKVYAQEVVNLCRLLSEHGVRPVFFVFSPPGTDQAEYESKFNELKEQCLQKVKEVSVIHQVCDGVAGLGDVKWRLTEFAALHVESVLKSEGIRFLYWTGGTYSEIVRYCQRNKQAFGILSGNTELVIPSGARLFLPELFQFQRMCSDILEDPLPGIVCEFVTSVDLACSLLVDEKQLRDLAVLCGNGYTSALNECLNPCATLMLPDSSVTTVAQWLSGNKNPLLECDELKEFLENNTCYKHALIYSYHSYACLEPEESEEIELNKFKYVYECVKNGTMSPHLLSMVKGYYWRPVITELVTSDCACFVNFTFLLRKSVYAILGLEWIREFGCTSQNSFVTISSQALSKSAEVDYLEELCALRQKPTNEKLSLLFHLVGGEKEVPEFDEALRDETYLDADASDDCGAAVLACSALLFMFHSNFHCSPSPEITICELEALLLTCLASLTEFSGFDITDCPSSRAIIVSDWFSHVLEQLYLIASLFGLTGKLPSPGEVFSSILYLSFHSASYASIEKEMKGCEDNSNVSESVDEDSQTVTALKLFNEVINLESVLSLRAEILNEDKADLKTFIVLFSKSLQAVQSALCNGGLKQSVSFALDTVNERTERADELATDTDLKDTDSSFETTQATSSSREMTSIKDDECEEDMTNVCAIMTDIEDLHNCSDVSRTDCEELSSTQEQQVAEEDVFFLHGGLKVNSEVDFEHLSDKLDTSDNERAVDVSDSDASDSENEFEEDTILQSAFDTSENDPPHPSFEGSLSDNDLPVVCDSVPGRFSLSSQCESETLPQTKRDSSSLKSSSLDNPMSPGPPKDRSLPSHCRLSKQKQSYAGPELPIMAHKEKILELIQSHSVVILEGETGCGKSTNVPQFILEESLKCPSSKPCKILITQPRRVAAMKLAEKVALDRRERIGKTVGFCISGESQHSADTAITYCTTGYLLQLLMNNPMVISMYTHIILDEVHERSTDAEFALLVVRKLVVDVCGFKVILMSATLQGDLFITYFEQVLPKSEVASPYFVGTKQYDIDIYFMNELDSLAEGKTSHWHASQLKASAALKTLVRTMPKENLQTAMKVCPSVTKFTTSVSIEVILSQGECGESVLVFLPGISEIMSYQETLLQELCVRNVINSFSVFILHSQVPFEEQNGLFDPPPPNKVHVILATNIAESSITLPKLRLVINFGIYRQLQYDSKRRFSCLVKRWCSHSSCAQRVGRAGRVFKGVAIHLFTRRFYEVILPEYNPPDMLSAPLAKLVLQAKQIGAKLGFPSPSELLMLAPDPPSLEQMEIAVQELANLGAIVSEPGKEVTETADITFLGNFCLSLPADILHCRLVLFGIFFGIPTEAIITAAEMSLTQDVFSLPSRCVMKDEGKYFDALLRTIDTRVGYDRGQFSESFIVCRMFREWIEYRNDNARSSRTLPKKVLLSNFCRSHAVRSTRLLQLETTVAQIASRVLNLIPERCQVYEDISSLATIAQYGSINRKGGFLHRKNAQDHELHVNFSEDPLILKSLLVASFSHQMVVGVREIESHFSKMKKKAQTEVAYMVETRIDPARMIVMRNMEHKCSSVLYELLSQLLPGIQVDVKISSNTIFICLPPTPAAHLHQPVTRGRTSSNLFKAEAWKTFEQEVSVISKKLSRDLYVIWQFGERKAVWTVSGISASFSRPHHPMSLAWYNLSVKREQVGISSFRNPSAFVCDFSSSSPFLGIATMMQGCEHKHFIVARKLTVLPNLRSSATAIILAIAFQPLNSSLELLVDSVERKVTGLKINSQEIVFGDYQSITDEDIIRINVLRRWISKALCSHAPGDKLSMEGVSNICPLIECVLKRTPFQPLTACSSPLPDTTETISPDFCLPRWEQQFSLPSADSSDDDDSEFEIDNTVEPLSQTGCPDQNGFCFFPALRCSLLNSSILKESDVEQFLSLSTGQGKSSRSCFPLNKKSGRPTHTVFKLSPLAKPFIPIVNSRSLPHSVMSSSSCANKSQASREAHEVKNQDAMDESLALIVPTCQIAEQFPPSPLPNAIEQDFQDTFNSESVLGSSVVRDNLVDSQRRSVESEVGSLQTPLNDYVTYSDNPSAGTLQPVHFELPQWQWLPSDAVVCSSSSVAINNPQSLTGPAMSLLPPSDWQSSQAAAYFQNMHTMMMLAWQQQAMVQRSFSNTIGPDGVEDSGLSAASLASVKNISPPVAKPTCKDPSADEKSSSKSVDFPSVSASLSNERIFSPLPQAVDETDSLPSSQPSPNSQACVQVPHSSPITTSQDLLQPQSQVQDLEQDGNVEFSRTGFVFLPPPPDHSSIPLPPSNSSLQSSPDASQQLLSYQKSDQDSQHLFNGHSEDRLKVDSPDKLLDVFPQTYTVPLLPTPALTFTAPSPRLASPPGFHNASLHHEPLNCHQVPLQPCSSQVMLLSDFGKPSQSSVQPLFVTPCIPQSIARSIGMSSPAPINEIQCGVSTWSHQRQLCDAPSLLPVGSPSSHRVHSLSPSSHRTHTLSPSSHRTHPLSPSSHRTHPLSPSSHRTHTLSPSSHRTHPLSPSSHRTHPLSPSSHRTHPLSPPGYPALQITHPLSSPGFPASHWAHPLSPPTSHMTHPLSPPGCLASHRVHPLSPPASHRVHPLSPPASHRVHPLSPPATHRVHPLSPPASHMTHPLSPPGFPAFPRARTLPQTGSPSSHRTSPWSPQTSQVPHTLPPPGSPSSKKAHPFSPPAWQNSEAANITADSEKSLEANLSSPPKSLPLHSQKETILIPPINPQASQIAMQQKALLLSLGQVASLESQTEPQHLKHGSYQSCRSHQPHSTHRYTQPEAFVKPPFRGPSIRPPFQRYTSPQDYPSLKQRRGKHLLPTSVYTGRYDHPPRLQSIVKSLPIPRTATSSHVGTQEETYFVNDGRNFEKESRKQSLKRNLSIPWSQACPRDSDQHNPQSIGHETTRVEKERRQKKGGKTTKQELCNIDRQDLVDFYIRILFLLGDAELNQLCGTHYRQFLEQCNIQANTVILDPCFFTVKNKGVFKVCGPPGMYRVSLAENAKHLVASRQMVTTAMSLDKKSVWSEKSGNRVNDTESKETRQIRKRTIVPSDRSNDHNEEYSPSIARMISGQVEVQLPSPSNRNGCVPCSSEVDISSESNSTPDKVDQQIEYSASKPTVENTPSDWIDRDCLTHSCEVVCEAHSDEVGFDMCSTIHSGQSARYSANDVVIDDSVAKTRNGNSLSKPTHDVPSHAMPMEIEGSEPAIEGNKFIEPAIERSKLVGEESETILEGSETTVSSGKIPAPICLSPVLHLHAKHAIDANHSTLNLTLSEHIGSESTKSSRKTSVSDIKPPRSASSAVRKSSNSSLFTSPNKIDRKQIAKVKGDAKVKGYSTTCTNAATAVATYSQSSNSSLSSLPPPSFDEDCWVEGDSPISTQTAKAETKEKCKLPQKHSRNRSHKENIEKKKRGSRHDPTKGKRLLYKNNDSGWENLDVFADDASVQGSSETDSLVVESEKTHQVSKKIHKDKSSSKHPSADPPGKPAVGSFPHFLAYTESILLKEDTIPLFLHCSNYRDTFRLSKRKCWYEVRDLKNSSEIFEIEFNGKTCVIVRKDSSCSSVDSKVDKSQEPV